MNDEQCVHFLQWALPQLHMRWDGFRKVRRQVRKRLSRRLKELGLADADAYRDYLHRHAEEWHYLDTLCRITISRFYRDKGVYAALSDQVLPALARAAQQRGDKALRVWSAGCGAGEEPYTTAILWHLELRARYPDLRIEIVATDADPAMLARAREANYAFASVKDVPPSLRDEAFEQAHGAYRLKPAYRRGITFLVQDIRNEQAEGPFDLVLCRNLVFTYFDDALQAELLGRIVATMRGGAALVLGIHEELPPDTRALYPWFDKLRIYRVHRSASRTDMIHS
jgi:chemotaxis protein methyltransferase CheR